MAKKKAKAKGDLSLDEVQQIKTALWSAPPLATAAAAKPAGPSAALSAKTAVAAAAAAAAAPAATLVAEGDSWFDYPPGMDILDYLKHDYNYAIVKLSAAGDTLENMAFGTEINDRDFTRAGSQIPTLVNNVIRYRPRAVLLSGGGNDVAGDELLSYLNHADSGLPKLRVDFLEDVVNGSLKSAIEAICKNVWTINPNLHVVTHGYCYPIPDGRAVFNFPFGFRYLGPWLKPAFTKKDITNFNEARTIIRQIMDAFNTMLQGLQAANPTRFHYIDLRSSFQNASDWVNELHLNNAAYRKVAARFHTTIKGLP